MPSRRLSRKHANTSASIRSSANGSGARRIICWRSLAMHDEFGCSEVVRLLRQTNSGAADRCHRRAHARTQWRPWRRRLRRRCERRPDHHFPQSHAHGRRRRRLRAVARDRLCAADRAARLRARAAPLRRWSRTSTPRCGTACRDQCRSEGACARAAAAAASGASASAAARRAVRRSRSCRTGPDRAADARAARQPSRERSVFRIARRRRSGA